MKGIMKRKKLLAIVLSFALALSAMIGVFGFTKTYAATVGDKIYEPEDGWKRIDDINTNFQYTGIWSTTTNNDYYYHGTVHYVGNGNNVCEVKFNFTGTKLRLIGKKETAGCTAVQVKIDGVMETYSIAGTQTTYTITYEKVGLSNSEHTVEIYKPAQATGGTYWFDAIDIDSNGEIKPYNPNPETSIPVSSISLNKNILDLALGSTETLTATILPENATNKNILWNSSDTNIATIDNTGKVTAVKVGKAIITATSQDGGKTATCEVNVTQPVGGITLDKTTLDLNVGQSDTLTATITPNDATNKNVTWSSSDSSIATVDNNGKVTGIAPGTATITVTTEDGKKTATCTVTVNNPSRALLEITMSNNERKEFDLPMSEVNKFVDWYNSKSSPSYKIDKNNNVKPFNSRVEYIAHDKVSSFEVKEYTDTKN